MCWKAGHGGTISITGKTINIQTGLSLTANGSSGSDGSGGSITIGAAGSSINIQNPTAPLTFTANGAGATGNGGLISFTSNSTTALTIGSAAGNLTLSATGTNGGSISVSTGGDLTVNTAQLTPGPTNGAGAGISLLAGTAGPGILTLVGTLSADASGTPGNYGGIGGSLTLQTNIPTVFTVPLFSVAGTSNGSVDITNAGAGLSVTVPYTNISNLSLKSTGGSGSISISKPIGNAATSSITLMANGTGKVTDAQITLAGSLTLASGSGAISVTKFNGSFVSANTTGMVAVTNTGAALLSIGASSGSTLTIKSAGNMDDTGAITAGTVLLQSTSKTGIVSVDAAIDANLKTITLTGIGGVNVGPGGSLTATTGVTATSTGIGAVINVAGNIEVSGLKGTIKLTAPGGVHASASDLGALGSITLSAAKGDVQVGSIGTTFVPTTVTLTGFTGITTGAVTALNTITETAAGPSAAITINGNTATTSLLTGIVKLTAAGLGGSISSNNDISAFKSITLAAAKGTVAVNTVGARPTLAPATITISALNQLISNGKITATGAITLKTTSTVVATGNLTVHDDISTSMATGKVTITTGAPGAFDQTAGAINASAVTVTAPGGITIDGNITSTNAVAVTAAKGSIAVGPTSTISSSAKTVTMSAMNDLHELGTVTAHTGVTLKTTLLSTSSVVDVQNVSTDAGTISIVGNGAAVNILSGAVVQVGSSGTRAATGKIIVENANKALGVINIADSTIETFVASSATTGVKAKGNGDVIFTIGPAPTAPKVGIIPVGVNFQINHASATPGPTGPFFFGTSGITVNSAPSVTMSSVSGGRVIFNAGVNAFGITITPGAGQTIITADPPPPVLPISATQLVGSESELVVDTSEDSDADMLVDQPEPLKAVSY